MAVLAVGACARTEKNPNYCVSASDECPEGRVCNVETRTCVVAGDAGTGGGQGTGGRAATGGAAGGAADAAVGGAGGNGGTVGTGGSTTPDGGADRPGDAGADMAMGCPPCTGATPICDMTERKCVGCLLSNQCTTTPGKSVCDTTTKTCVGCLQSDQCPTDKPVCDTAATAKVCVGCLQSSQCPTDKPVCDTAATAKVCVGCLQSSQCTTATKPICGATKTCGACTADMECSMAASGTPFCLSSGACAECKVKADCAAKMATPACSAANKCVECTVDSECRGTKPICDTTKNICVGCSADPQCMAKNADTPACVTTAGATMGSCVACTTHAHCKSAPKPVCVANACAACTTDQQCVDKSGADPGVCMSHTDGHCATDTDVLYVKPITGCSDTGMGTATVPFCNPQPAINAVTANKNVVVMRKGPFPLVQWSFAGTGTLNVIGQGGASVGPGAGVGITITSGEVYIRNLGISGMGGLGVSVAANATLKMDGCIVAMNNGGLAVNGGGFEINNSVFAENLAATAPAAFAGVYLKSGASTPARFRNNTIYANMGAGLVCDGAYPVRGLLVASNSGGHVTGCDFADGSSVVGMTVTTAFDPARPYHLTAGSACVDMGHMTDFPARDIDGSPRPSPAGGRSDCGAHELQK